MRPILFLLSVVVVLASCTAPIEIAQPAGNTPSASEAPTSAPGATTAADTHPDSRSDSRSNAATHTSSLPYRCTFADAGTTPDLTPIVLLGEAWTLTEADVNRLANFVEEVHDLSFTSTVTVRSDDDIGANYAQGLESFPDDDWRLLRALGLVEPTIDRSEVNQLRLDRVRGLCCREDGDGLVVIVEPRATKLETELIVIHELVHALHAQHPDLHGRPDRSAGFELPDPTAGILEGIAQFIAFEYFGLQPEAQQALVEPALVIVDDELMKQSGTTPGHMLNFSYFTAPGLAQAAYDERGAEGLSDLLAWPPTTTEQVVYPDRWLAAEGRVSQEPPTIPDTARFVNEGRLGVAMLGWMLDPVADRTVLEPLLREWTGDRWTLYSDLGEDDCVSATIEMDTSQRADDLADLLSERYGHDTSVDSHRRVRFDTCQTRLA